MKHRIFIVIGAIFMFASIGMWSVVGNEHDDYTFFIYASGVAIVEGTKAGRYRMVTSSLSYFYLVTNYKMEN
ncbi:MAG: hypothetical protein DRN05_02660 [Thermoplasmata archaeon]|nr:MAG: hypothetical protein DRN05_02660 [Thermoplasmata archaeon]